MAPIRMAGGLAGGRYQELLRNAERRRLAAALPAGPALLQRSALRVAGWAGGPQ